MGLSVVQHESVGVSGSGERPTATPISARIIITSAVMNGLVPVTHVVKPPEMLRIGRKRRRVDGRDKPWDKPGHDGEGSLNDTACVYPSAPPRLRVGSRLASMS
jgi:hypothetical protein